MIPDYPCGVSVIIPVYNAEKYVAPALDSVLAQTRPCQEIIVVDDGSTDNTAAIIRRYGEQVRYTRQENAGVSVARNTGIKAACGTWIAFLDSDDEWMPEKNEMQLQLLQDNPQLQWICSNYVNCSGANEKQVPAHPPERTQDLLNGRAYFPRYSHIYTQGVWAWTSTVMVKRSVFDTVGLFRPNYLFGGDTDMWLRISCVWPAIGYVNRLLAVYHVDVPDSITTKPRSLAILFDQIEQILAMGQGQDHPEEFNLCAAAVLRYHLRFFQKQGYYQDLLKSLARFSDLLPSDYTREMRLRARFPRLTSKLLGLKRRLLKTLGGVTPLACIFQGVY